MAIYKVLSIGQELVVGGDERWDSLADALNELATAGWDLEHLVGVSLPQPERFASETWIASAVLVNRSRSAREDLERQIEKLKNRIAAVEQRRDTIPEDEKIKRFSVTQDIEELSKRLELLQQRALDCEEARR